MRTLLFIMLTLLADPVGAQQWITIPLIYRSEGHNLKTSACLGLPVPAGQGPERKIYDEWVKSTWGPAKTQAPEFCPATDFTHETSWGMGRLEFAGYDLTAEYFESPVAAQVLALWRNMQHAVRQGYMDDYFDAFTERGAAKQRAWYMSEQSDEIRAKYIDNILTQRPVFVIDAEPVLIVYTRGGSNPVTYLRGNQGPSDVQVMYFVREAGGFKRTGGSVGSVFDDVFQGQRFVAGALEETPFGRWKKR